MHINDIIFKRWTKVDNIVFLNKKFKGLEKIIQGEKTAESRWANGKKFPHGKVNKGDRLFFKSTGKPVTATAEVIDVLNLNKLEKDEIQEIIQKYNDKICMCEEEVAIALQKKCGFIVFFDGVKEIDPIEIDKSSFGSMADWIIVDDINMITM